MPSNYTDSFLSEWKDDATRKVYTFAPDGTQSSIRDYTPEENAEADAAAAELAIQTESAARKAVVKQIVTDLQAEKARVQMVIDKSNAQITAGDTKDVARAAKRIADAAIDIARLLTAE